MPYKEREIEKVYWTIGEAAGMVHQATSALRFWEMEFNWLKPKKNKKGNRQYTKSDLQVVCDINYLLNAIGMTCKGVKQAHELEYDKTFMTLHSKIIRHEPNYNAQNLLSLEKYISFGNG